MRLDVTIGAYVGGPVRADRDPAYDADIDPFGIAVAPSGRSHKLVAAASLHAISNAGAVRLSSQNPRSAL